MHYADIALYLHSGSNLRRESFSLWQLKYLLYSSVSYSSLVFMSLLISLSTNSSLLSTSAKTWHGRLHLMPYTTFSTCILSLQDMTSLNCIPEAIWPKVGWYKYTHTTKNQCHMIIYLASHLALNLKLMKTLKLHYSSYSVNSFY